jgi:uncharacterized protein
MKLAQRHLRMMIGLALLLVFLFSSFIPYVHAESISYKEEIVPFKSTDMTMEGTLLLPLSSEKHPVVVLVHGSNSSDREKYRQEAEMFVKAGIAALIYDKRPDGFSESRGGDRSYTLLAEDVLSAVAALQSRSDIDQKSIGLWGISEGAWVASLAASQSPSDVGFLITVGAVGVKPVQQQSWLLMNRLGDQGVSAKSMTHAFTQQGLKFAVSAGMFAEALYDPVPIYEQLKLPVLAIWGNNDRVGPPLESSRIIQEALERAGNTHYTIRYFEGAGHLMRTTPDGIKESDTFLPGYAEEMTTWVKNVTLGKVPGASVVGNAPTQEHHSPEGITDMARYHSAWLQAGVMLVLVVGFLGYLITRAVRFMRKSSTSKDVVPGQKTKLFLAGSAIISMVGFVLYFGFLMSSGAKNLAPVLFDRTLVWLILQVCSLVAAVSTILLGRTWWKSRFTVSRSKRTQTILFLIGGGLFISWALYWQLLLP